MCRPIARLAANWTEWLQPATVDRGKGIGDRGVRPWRLGACKAPERGSVACGEAGYEISVLRGRRMSTTLALGFSIPRLPASSPNHRATHLRHPPSPPRAPPKPLPQHRRVEDRCGQARELQLPRAPSRAPPPDWELLAVLPAPERLLTGRRRLACGDDGWDGNHGWPDGAPCHGRAYRRPIVGSKQTARRWAHGAPAAFVGT